MVENAEDLVGLKDQKRKKPGYTYQMISQCGSTNLAQLRISGSLSELTGTFRKGGMRRNGLERLIRVVGILPSAAENALQQIAYAQAPRLCPPHRP